jgi:hypothetical protein
LAISSLSNSINKLISTKKYNIRVNKIHVINSKIGYILETLFLQYLHFHLFFNHEKIGIKSNVFNIFLHFGQWLLPQKIHHSPLFNLYITTDEKLQNIIPNIKKKI